MSVQPVHSFTPILQRNVLTIALIDIGEHEGLLHSLSADVVEVLEEISSAIEVEGTKE
jgi:hypothetical protein